MPHYDRITDLEVEIEAVTLDRREQRLSDDFTRVTTIVELRGGGHVGRGEDVCYEPEEHDTLAATGLAVDVRGSWVFGELSHALAADLFPTKPPGYEGSRAFRRWGVESAALDLALRQADTTLGERLGLEPRPVSFVASMQLEPPGRVDRLLALRARAPEVRFKLDARSEWDDALVGAIAEVGGVEVIDLKGMYVDTPVDQPADPDLYARVARAFPAALIEDPAITPESEPALGADGLARVSWDAPINDLADVEAMPVPPAAINVKPSRVGSVERLLALYEGLLARNIPMYGGGQGELGVGRGHIQLLAALFHPDRPNDVAPTPYNETTLPDSLPGSPLPVAVGPGFSWEL